MAAYMNHMSDVVFIKVYKILKLLFSFYYTCVFMDGIVIIKKENHIHI